jgi:hypothetical protein
MPHMNNVAKIDHVKERHIADLNFRIDELHRAVKAIEERFSEAHIATLVHGALSALIAGNKLAPNSSVELAIRELVETLKKPTTRTAHLQLPSGPARMTVTEERK